MTSHMPGIDVPLSFLSHRRSLKTKLKRRDVLTKNILLFSISKIAVSSICLIEPARGTLIFFYCVAKHCNAKMWHRALSAVTFSKLVFLGRILEQEENLGGKVQVRPQPLQSYEKLAIPEKWSMFAQKRLKGKKIHQTWGVTNWRKNFMGLLILDLRIFMHIWASHLISF